MTIDLVQGTEEWRQARCGKVTASRVGDATARTAKGNWGAGRSNYMAELVIERLTGRPFEQYVSTAMQWGTMQEPVARAEYSFLMGYEIVEVGFVTHPTLASGASPDGLINDDGCVQFKCPNTATHIDTLLGAKVDLCYIKQMNWEMLCADRNWCDFVSFDPRLPPEYQLFIKHFERDDEMIAELEKDVGQFLRELDNKVSELRRRREIKFEILEAA